MWWNEGKDDRHRGRQMEAMRHRVPNNGKVLRERFVLLCFTVPLSHSFPVYFYPSSLPFSLSVWLPWLGCDLFSSLLLISVAILRGLTGYKDGQCVYTSLECGITSTLPYLMRGCICVGRKGWGEEWGSLRKRKGQRDRELACRQEWLHSTFTRQFYYLLVDRNSQGILGVEVWLRKLSVKIPPLEM